ncbi:MBL fold metallo-hydrolase [Urbifossiella limnaea]|uniref:Metal-dependent hydrolase n=1 Tax=Urbifossiella limnaea TaxID=2528023 RepID=A0A517XNK9_9BACT|nr:MBL fold metallo-hydrolase [Urbifossiella limnaea]QDU19093.1 metal-dependent hydrolase [Urbifossiella limnaea]
MRLPLVLVLLALAATAAAQPAKQPPEIERYRNYLLTAPAPEPKNGSVRVTWLGTATLLFDDGETQLMTDGFLTRPSLRKVLATIETEPKVVDAALAKAGVTKLAALFVAHTHYDHALDCAYVARKTGAVLHGSSSTLNVGRGGDVPEKQMVEFDHGQSYRFGKFSVTVLKSRHSPTIRFLNDDLGQRVERPLKQPASFKDYKEGGAFDFLISHGPNAVLVNAGGSYIEGARDGLKADVVFLTTAVLSAQPAAFQAAFYTETVGKVRPKLVVPIHWDNFMKPLTEQLDPQFDPADGWDPLIRRCRADGIGFGILPGYGRVTLFAR